MLLLTAWQNFYIIVGSAAGALIGLTFVVITLVTARRAQTATTWGVNAFTTPTVVHFCVVLFISAILSAPWSALAQVAVMLGLCGLAAVGYSAIVVRRLRRRTGYEPVREDWIWYAVLPFAAYIALLVFAIMLPGSPALALFGTGAVMLLLLFIGIRNAWDVATYITIDPAFQQRESEKSDTSPRQG